MGAPPSFDLKAPYQDPMDPGDPSTRLIGVFILGNYVEQWEVDEGYYPACLLGSGSDSDWGFGTCDAPPIWSLNSGSQHITLKRIPNPSVPPK